MSRPLVVYHGPGCADGFTAAWVAWRRFGDQADYLPAQYGDAPPDVSGRDVYVLDFSYPRDVLVAMKGRAASLLVLDHHKTAQADLAGLDFCVFDMNRSGARLAWNNFFDGDSVPLLVEYVQDRDLWRWKLPNSKEVSAALASYSKTFAMWTTLSESLNNQLGAGRIFMEGSAILRAQAQQVDQIVSHAEVVSISVGDQKGLRRGFMVCSPVHQSEVGEALAIKSGTFGAVWYRAGEHPRGIYRVSLRSRSGYDVSEIARHYGGGGHAQAAGFECAELPWTFDK